MARIRIAVSDTGLLTHLGQTGYLNVFKAIEEISVSGEVIHELNNGHYWLTNHTQMEWNERARGLAKYPMNRGALGAGETTSIALAKHEKVRLFIDDLEAREVASAHGLEPRGTSAIVTRSYRKKVICKQKAINCIDKLHRDSTLYLTANLVHWEICQIKK